MPSLSMNVRCQSSRFSRLQMRRRRRCARRRDRASSASTAAGSMSAALARAAIEQHVARDLRSSGPASSAPNGTGNPIFGRFRIDVRQHALHRLAQDPLGRPARQLPLVGQRRRELDQLVIEERHAAFDRRRHAHLVLLHQQLDQVGLDVGVEQPIEQRARCRSARSK